MKHNTAIIFSLCLVALLTAGCSRSSNDIEIEETPQAETESRVMEVVSAGKGDDHSEDVSSSASIIAPFEAVSVGGDTLTSSEIFSASELTMVNVWATYCAPCLNEMGDLGEISREYDKSKFQIVGIVADVSANSRESAIDEVSRIIELTGADYLHLYSSNELYSTLLRDVMYVPTTFFVNSKGEILATYVGSRDKDEWEEIINGLLDQA